MITIDDNSQSLKVDLELVHAELDPEVVPAGFLLEAASEATISLQNESLPLAAASTGGAGAKRGREEDDASGDAADGKRPHVDEGGNVVVDDDDDDFEMLN